MRLDVAFWLLNPDGSYRCPLPDHGKWTLSPIAGQPGAITLDYPVTGQNFSALREHHDADRDAQVAIWIGGQDDGSLRALLVAEDADDIDEQAVWTFTGHFTEVRMEEAVITPRTEVVVPPGGDVPTEDLAAFRIYSATAGTIMGTLMQEAQAEGELADLTYGFTGTHDSNGVAWSQVITLKFAPGVSFLKVLESLDEYQLCEWAVVDGELELYEPGTRGVDRTLGADPVILRRGRDMTDSSRKRTIRGAPTDLVVAGAEGLYVRVHDDTARARRGRIITAYASAGSLNDEGSLLAYGQAKLAQLVHGTMEVTHGLSLGDEGPVPLLDYGVSDWLWSDTGRPELERLQVAQITVSGDETGEITGSVSLNDLIASRQAELARRISGIEGGSTITGTSQARPVPEGPDTMAPAAPQGVSVTSLAQPSADPVPRAAVYVSWPPVTTNADQTAIEDLDGYLVQFRYLADTDPDSWIEPVAQAPYTSASWSGVRAGAAISVRVAAVDRSGNRSEWSDEATHTTEVDGQPPPVPSAPELSSYVAIVAVSWDGLGSLGEPMPADFHRVEVHVSTTSDFTPDRPADLSASTTYAGPPLYGVGVLPYQGAAELAVGTTLFVRLVAVDLLGNASAASVQASIVTEAIEDGDIAGMSVGKLQAGIMSALMTVSGIIQTSQTGSRVRLDSTGFRCIASNGDEVLVYEIATGVMSMTGALYARGSGDAKIDIIPSTQPTMYFGSEDGAFGEAFMNAFDTGDPGQTGLGINSGRSNASGNFTYSRVFLAPKALEVAVVDENQSLDGGYLKLGAGPDGYIGFGQQYGGGSTSSVQINPDGAIQMFVNGGTELLLVPGAAEADRFQGYGGAAGRLRMDSSSGEVSFRSDGGTDPIMDADFFGPRYVKNFVIDHPTDPDRWLVHACTETPEAAVEYSGVVEVKGWEAEVVLPDYFERLTQVEGRQVWLQVLLPEEGGFHRYLPRAAASLPHEGRFRISTDADDCTRIAWKVKAIRADVPPLDAEPHRDTVHVHGDGPYRYLTPREAG